MVWYSRGREGEGRARAHLTKSQIGARYIRIDRGLDKVEKVGLGRTWVFRTYSGSRRRLLWPVDGSTRLCCRRTMICSATWLFSPRPA